MESHADVFCSDYCPVSFCFASTVNHGVKSLHNRKPLHRAAAGPHYQTQSPTGVAEDLDQEFYRVCKYGPLVMLATAPFVPLGVPAVVPALNIGASAGRA